MTVLVGQHKKDSVIASEAIPKAFGRAERGNLLMRIGALLVLWG
jgi:hypothetical protein